MSMHERFFSNLLFIFLLFSASVAKASEINAVKNSDGSKWYIEKENEDYYLRYVNSKGIVYSNSEIITPDITGSGLFLDTKPLDNVSLVMDYPKNIYIFEFSSGDIPFLLSACHTIILSSVEPEQAVAQMTLCSKDNESSGLDLTHVDANKLLDPDNLVFVGKVKTSISDDKSFLYHEDGTQKHNKPYLIKGDIVEIISYKKNMLKIKYASKSGTIIGWIKFSSIL